MRTIPALAIALALLLAPDAFAATASVRTYAPYPSLTQIGLFYAAAPGERNQVVAVPDSATAFPYDILLRDTGAVITPGPGCSSIDEHDVRCTAALLAPAQSPRPELGVIVDVADGDDTVTMPANSLSPVSVVGGDGNDVLTGAGALFGGAGNDVLTGGDDAACKGCGQPPDVLAGGAGDDVLRAGSGDDTLSGDGDVPPSTDVPASPGPDRGGGNDVIDAGAGEFDRVLYDGRTAGVHVDLADTAGVHGAPGERDRISGAEVVVGGSGDDVLLGDEGRNRLEGGAGNNRLRGRGGWDTLQGGPGVDVLDGGDGRDRLYGATGRDTLRGGEGDDELAAGGPGAVLDGGPGSDLLSARHPRILRCGRGNDMVARPRGLLLAGCESVRLGRFIPAYYDTATVSVKPRRVRGGGVGVAWSCEATANRCDLRVTVRAGSTMLGRRGAVLFKRDAKGEIVVGRRRAVRRGQLLDISISGAIYESDYKDGRTQRFTASWRIRL